MGKPGDACRLSALTHTKMKDEGKRDEVGIGESCGLCWIFARRYSGQRGRTRDVETETWTDGDLQRDWQGEWKRKRGKEIDRCTDKQTVGVGGEGARDSPRVVVDSNDQKTLNSIIVIQLAFLWVLWTTVLADLLQKQLHAKSWPWRQRGRPRLCGSLLRCLSQHGEVCADCGSARPQHPAPPESRGISLPPIKPAVYEWQWGKKQGRWIS